MTQDMSPRISDHERDTAIERLQEAFAEGLVDREEMDERLQLALTATTHGELEPVLASLPDRNAGEAVAIEAAGGRIKRNGAWRVPRTLKVESPYGKVELDLSQAVIEHPVIDIELRLNFGWARVILPPDATVEYDALRADWKQPVYKAARRPGNSPGRPHVRISGAMEYGRLKVKHSRR